MNQTFYKERGNDNALKHNSFYNEKERNSGYILNSIN